MAAHRIALLVASVVALAAAPSDAASLPYESSLRFELGSGSVVSIAVEGSGVATLNGASPAGGAISLLALPANVVSTTGLIVDISDPSANPIRGIALDVGAAAGTFSGAPLGGTLPVSGFLKFCLFDPCLPAPLANLTIPLGVVGVSASSFATGVASATVIGQPWTTGTVPRVPMLPSFAGSISGFAHGPLSATTSAANVGGVVQLVSPIFLDTSLGTVPVPFHAELTLRFVPEPTTALLLSGGIVALGIRGTRLRRGPASRTLRRGDP